MSSAAVNPLSAGLQELYNTGLLPTSLSNTTLNNASSGQLNQLASTSVALSETATLLGLGSTSSTDTTSLSSNATDALTKAINNELTSSLDSAVSKFLPQQSTATNGSIINVLG